MLYAIYAYESNYGGLHGMNTSFIEECSSIQEAEEAALQASIEVMESYSEIFNILKDETEDCECEVYDMEVENSAYEIYLITKDTHGKDICELEEEFYNDREGFVEEYCN